jgi:hypothetical protein
MLALARRADAAGGRTQNVRSVGGRVVLNAAAVAAKFNRKER